MRSGSFCDEERRGRLVPGEPRPELATTRHRPRSRALDGLCAWNNLGRNVVFADEAFRPRAVFDESVFTEDEPSQYDLDVHAILEMPSAGVVLVLEPPGHAARL